MSFIKKPGNSFSGFLFLINSLVLTNSKKRRRQIMARYNAKRETKSEVQPVITHQGGEGYTQRVEKELVGLLASGLSNTYYEKETERENRFKDVLKRAAQKNSLFVAKALIYARTIFGQRSVTHYGAVELIPFLSGSELGKRFFSKRDRKENRGGIVYRLDDMAEILACYQAKNGVDAPIPNAIKKGFKEAIEHSDTYTLAKYQMKSRGVSLVDIVNLVRPVSTKMNGTVTVTEVEYQKAITGTKWDPKNKKYKAEYANILVRTEKGVQIPALHALVIGVLKQFNTVEDKNTEVGKTIAEKVKKGEITVEQAKVELNDAKTENYAELIKTKKIGYLALLRNIRNILKTGDVELLDMACEQLVDEQFIKKSLVFPHEIDLALEIMLTEFNGRQLAKVTQALNTAYERSIPNLAELFNEGRTAVVLDVSGSMSTYIQIGKGKNGSTSALDKGSLVAATLAKGIGAELFAFASSAAKVNFNPLDSIHSIKKDVTSREAHLGGGTYWGNIFPLLSQHGKFDRVFIISDEQGCDQVETTYKSYCQKYGTPNVFVINICGYAPTMLKESTKVHRLYGYTAAIYETAKQVEIDLEAVIHEINKIEI
jgi:60 kDa SS-A/Ro ribonucleoprotein